jgi:hypothetical protein
LGKNILTTKDDQRKKNKFFKFNSHGVVDLFFGEVVFFCFEKDSFVVL